MTYQTTKCRNGEDQSVYQRKLQKVSLFFCYRMSLHLTTSKQSVNCIYNKNSNFKVQL